MTLDERRQKALHYHASTMNCAQSVLGAFSDVAGLTEAQIFGLAGGLGGGIKYGGLCGAVSAAVIVLGTRYPHTLENGLEGKERITALTREFQRRFAEKNGALDCRDLLARAAVADGSPEKTAYCNTLIVSSVELLSEMLEEMEKE